MHNRYAVFDRPDDDDRLSSVTATVIKRTAATLGTTAALVVGSLLLAGPASADVPVGWGTQEPVDKLHVLGFLVGIPVLLFVLITAFVYLPSLARGERVAPGATRPEDQWLGGRRSAGEITSGAKAVATQDGGASARW